MSEHGISRRAVAADPPPPAGEDDAVEPLPGSAVLRRILAYLIDLAVVGAVAVAVYLPTMSWLLTAVIVTELILGLWLWEVHSGRTIGKALLGLRAAQADRNYAPGLKRGAIRGGLLGASHGLAVLGPIGLIGTAHRDRSGRGQAWHDRVAGTRVVDIREDAPDLARAEDGEGSDTVTTAPFGHGPVPPGAHASSVPAVGAHAASMPAAGAHAASAPAVGAHAASAAPSPEPGQIPPIPLAPHPPAAGIQHGSGRPTAAPATPSAPSADQFPGPSIPHSTPAQHAPAAGSPQPGGTPTQPPPAGGSASRADDTLAGGQPGPPAPSGPRYSVPASGGRPQLWRPHSEPPPREVPDDGERQSHGRRRNRNEPNGADTVFVLTVDGGVSVTVSGSGLIGRHPQPSPGERFDHLVAVDDPGRSLSRTHAEFGVEGDALWISDRGSANGTVVLLEDGGRVRAMPRKRVSVPEGARVVLGERAVSIERWRS